MEFADFEAALARQGTRVKQGEKPSGSGAASPRKGGRPPGSKNKTAATLLTEQKLNALYERAQPFLDEEMREYLRDVISGRTRVDPEREMELLVAYLRLLLSEGTAGAITSGTLTMDLAKFAGELRMSVKDLHEIQRRNREDKKTNDDEGLVDVTSKPSLGRFQRVISGTG